MIGRTIGHYRILGHLGGGGMGVVYKAEDTRLGRIVALKLLPPELTRDPDAKHRFEREARAAALLDHPNICTTYDFGEAEGDGQMYIAMAYYGGESLAERVTRGPLSLDDAIKILEQICRGLGHAHAAGVIHRDIKPGNVMLTTGGIVKIVDFGLAKLSAGSVLTKSRTSVGTAAYMAPEQLRGEEVGPQTDIWASGVVLFELLAGTRPFRGEYAEALSYSILNEQPATVTELRPDLPVEIDRIIKKTLRKDPLQRYANTDEVIAELEVLRTPSSASGKSGPRSAKLREPLRPGAKLGPYEIVEPLGSGGMGDVYRARDTRLDRQVAIKVLAPEFSEDAERKQRFQREAKTISSLSHPNICTLFDVGEQEGTDYLVMEYLEGETLADRLTRGALPLTELLKTGIQIGEALGRAHQQGIVHRDLKPGNVMLTKTGTVKLLDFGLAKDVGTVTTTTRRRSGSPSPDKPLTAEGAIVGTLAYMAPEQVEGREADARSDIFAFGAILYEMATGKRAFEGATKASLIAALLTAQPALLDEIRRGMASTSGNNRGLALVEHVVRQCLEKDPDRRWQNAIDVANELRWLGERAVETGGSTSAGVPLEKHRRWQIALLATSAIAVAAIGAAFWAGRRSLPASRSESSSAARSIPTLVHLTTESGAEVSPSISPDGASFAYVGGSRDWSGRDVFVRRIGGENAINLTKDCEKDDTQPAFSPDGAWIAYHSECDGGGIFIIGATGESRRRLIDFGEWPSWSRDGRSLVVIAGEPFGASSPPPRTVFTIDVATGTKRKIFEGYVGNACWSPSGRRIALSRGLESNVGAYTLWTIPAGGGVPVEVSWADRAGWVTAWTRDGIWFSAPASGTSGIWRVPVDEVTGASLGAPELILRSPSNPFHPSPTADGQRVLFHAGTGGTSIVRWDFDPSVGKLSPKPPTVISGRKGLLVYGRPSPDGKWLVANADRPTTDLVLVRTDSGETHRLTNDALREHAYSWAPDSSKLYFCVAPKGSEELWSIRPDGSQRELVQTALPLGEIRYAVPSPDGGTLCLAVGKLYSPYLVDVSVAQGDRSPVALPAIGSGLTFAAADWSPDGQRLVGHVISQSGVRQSSLYVFEIAGRTYRKVAEVEEAPYPWSYYWLPDSRRVLATDSQTIKVVDTESGTVTPAGFLGAGLQIWNVHPSDDARSLFGNTHFSETDIWMLDYGTKP